MQRITHEGGKKKAALRQNVKTAKTKTHNTTTFVNIIDIKYIKHKKHQRAGDARFKNGKLSK
jgi:hypothetical protein